jgi:hypothetical protein
VAYYIGTPLDLFQRIAVSPASISTLYIGEYGARVIHVNHSTSFTFPGHGSKAKVAKSKKSK